MNHTNVVDVKAWIDTRPVSRFQWNVLLLCFIIIMLDGYDAAVMGFVAPALIEDWGISRADSWGGHVRRRHWRPGSGSAF
ncbi:4-hydroxybenzoate transporter [Klebsiella pneumoniae IS46]|nr:4-hydroxybenzoate transporter [Klebsiella pneumoniae IS46]